MTREVMFAVLTYFLHLLQIGRSKYRPDFGSIYPSDSPLPSTFPELGLLCTFDPEDLFPKFSPL